MKTLQTKASGLQIPAIGLGCMRIAALQDDKDVQALIQTAIGQGINFFDHADIYAGGLSEEIFGRNLAAVKRQDVIIQTKCSIKPGVSYDFSKEHILNSVNGSLKRLGTDYVDILLLHRPDTLMEPEEVAAAFDELQKSGKVRYFGVSNMNPGQIALLESEMPDRILFDQVQFSLAHCDIIDSGLNVNIENNAGTVRDGGLLEYTRLMHITLQAWSPFQYGMFEGTFIGSDKYPELNKVLEELAHKYNVSAGAVAVAWIMRHPAKIQTIVGTTKSSRLAETAKACEFTLEHDEWYRLYLAAGKQLP